MTTSYSLPRSASALTDPGKVKSPALEDHGYAGSRVSLATVDVSFISLEKVLPAIVRCLSDKAVVIALVKPQFEVGRGRVGKGGVVRDPARHREAVARVATVAATLWSARHLDALVSYLETIQEP